MMQGEQATLSPLNSVTFADVLEGLFPATLRHTRNGEDNVIEYRNIMLLGAQRLWKDHNRAGVGVGPRS